MSKCTLKLLLAHGESMFILMVFQSFLSICCGIFTMVFIYKQVKKLKCKRTHQKTTGSLSGRGCKNVRTIFNIQLIIVPLLFTLSAFLEVMNALFDIHYELPNNDNWINNIENICNIDLKIVTSIISFIVTIIVLSSYLGLLLVYFTRLVIIFDKIIICNIKNFKINFLCWNWIFYVINIINNICNRFCKKCETYSKY